MASMRPSRGSTVALVVAAAAAGGWACAFVVVEAAQVVPAPAWSVPSGLAVLAVLVMVVAWNLRRRLSSDESTRAKARPVSALAGVRYLAGAKACIHGGAALGGFYSGMALVLLLNPPQVQWSALAPCLASVLSSGAVALAGWFLERCCRVDPPSDAEPLAPS